MAALARYYLSIPASSAFSERCFSYSGNTRSLKRTSISDSKLEMMTVLKTLDPEMYALSMQQDAEFFEASDDDE